MNYKNVLVVIAVRPHFIKASSFSAGALNHKNICCRYLCIDQHYDETLLVDKFNIPNSYVHDLTLGTGVMNAENRLDLAVDAIWAHLKNIKPDLVLVIGDVDSTLAAAVAANSMGIPVAHIESGLRSRDPFSVEEFNRLRIDELTNIHLASEPSGFINIKQEYGSDAVVHLCGSLTIDALHHAIRSGVRSHRDQEGYVLVTIHRKENLNPDTIDRIVCLIDRMSKYKKIIFPSHPNTRRVIGGRNKEIIANIYLIDPISHEKCLSLIMGADFIITDSGGIQEETSALGVPCFTIRDFTERPITIERGTNILVPPRTIDNTTAEFMMDTMMDGLYSRKLTDICGVWDGRATDRIWDAISTH